MPTKQLSSQESHSLINIGEYLYGFQITEAISLDEYTSQYLAKSNQSSYNTTQREVVIRIANRSHHQESRQLLEKEMEAYQHLYEKGGSRYIPYLIKTVKGDEQVLIREFIYGVPLKELFSFIRNGPIISEACILELGLRLADATWGLLQKGIPYFQIQPEHILITPRKIDTFVLGRETARSHPLSTPEALLSMPRLAKQSMEYRYDHHWHCSCTPYVYVERLEDFDFLRYRVDHRIES